MTELNKMYDGVANSPDTFLTEPLASGGTIMYVADSSVFGILPNLAVIGNGANAETVLIKAKREDGGLDVDRAVEGKAKDWPKATAIARNFTNYDYKNLKENIEKLNQDKLEENSKIDFTEANAKENINSTDSVKTILGKLSKWFTNLQKIAWTGNLSDGVQDSDHRLVTDEEKTKWNGKEDSSNKGVANGYASLGADGKVPSEQLPKIDVLPDGGTTGQVLKKTTDGVAWQNDNNTTYSNATTSSSGLMSSSDKNIIDNLEKNFVPQKIKNEDFNNITTVGFYSVNSSANKPPVDYNYFGLIVTNSTNLQGNYVQQIAIPEKIDETSIWIRKKQSNNWGSWQNIISSDDYEYYFLGSTMHLYKYGRVISFTIERYKDVHALENYKMPSRFCPSYELVFSNNDGMLFIKPNGDMSISGARNLNVFSGSWIK
ncbi:pyocin knob domain-containing protein [Peptoniphilus sp.]|jgi:hypothetical protein|uniref:pyocin knob domain-containing protein n=1 Tax=Peptoniphilus sp. TaxID=1971214 RepID=UPI003D89B8BE